MSTTTDLSVRRPGSWRHEVLDRVGRLEQELARLAPPASSASDDVSSNLEAAKGIAGDEGATFDGWSGRNIENAWRYLRLAEEGLLDLVPEKKHDELELTLDRAIGHGTKHLPADDPMLTDLRTIKSRTTRTAEDRARIREVSQAVTVRAHEESTRGHQQQRAFRNQLRGLTIVLLALAVGSVLALAAVGSEGPTDLLPAPAGLAPWLAVALAMGLGSIGALFSAVPSLSQKPSEGSPFNTVKEQAALKVVVGAWSAVVGLVVVNAGITSIGVSGDDVAVVGTAAQAATTAGFAVMSAYFGATQEALTRFADRKASAVDPTS